MQLDVWIPKEDMFEASALTWVKAMEENLRPVAKELILELNLTKVKIAGIDVAYQFPIGLGPVVPTTKYFLEHGGGKYLDILTWHWYALESSRCPFKGKFSPATQSTAMSLNTLNKGDRWNIKLNELPLVTLAFF